MRKLSIKPTSSKAAKIVAPVAKPTGKPSTAPLGTAAADQAKRSNVVATAKPATPAAPTVAKPAAGINRTIRTIAARNTNFGGLSERDEAYFTFYRGLAKQHGGTVSVAQIHASGKRPAYNGSSKPHDAGVIVRLVKSGLITEASGVVSFTKAGNEHKLTSA